VLGLCLANAACGYVSGASDLEIVGAAEDPKWACIGEGAPLLRSEDVEVSAKIRNVATNDLIDEVVGRFCMGEPCTSPIAEVGAVDGTLTFPPISPSFDGYLELESPGMLPAVVELLRPIGAMRELPELRMIQAVSLKFYAASLQESIDDALGHALFWVQDCAGEPAAGVTIEPLDAVLATTRGYYVVDGKLPSPSIGETQQSGGGGFINLRTGYRLFAARLASDQRTISSFAARIRPGTVTFFVVQPE
jgi:hypothetical protein